MVDLIVGAVGGILSYFVGVFGSDRLFYPGFDAPFVAWKVLFAFVAAATVFLSRSGKGLIAVFVVGIISSIGLGLNYKSEHAFPPFWPATDIAWFCYQLGQSCFVGVGVRLAAVLSGILPKNGQGTNKDGP